MSGDIFQPMETQDDPDQPATRNPLLCYLCNEPYEEPCLMGCFHSFCARCLRGRSYEGKMVCPLCSYSHTLKEGSSLPPADLLLKFMVEASTEEKAQCANCDCTSVQMFFCNTCMQPLCAQCRQDTHRAKMFSSHDMVLLTKRAREVHKKCKIHEEPYIMFSSEKKIMLCINCFRDMRIESRGHCLDLETAYKQSCKKLDLKVQAFRELQNSVREGILLFRGLVEEIKNNADKERDSIQELHTELIKRLDETKIILLQKVDSQYTEKEKTFRSQLKALLALMPTLHTHLVISSAFSGSANKFEFLDLSYVLMDRLKSIVQKQHPLHATLSGQIDSGFKSEYYKSIEPLLYVPIQRPTLTTSACAASGVSAVSTGTSCPGSPVTFKITPTHSRRSNGLNGAKVKFIDAKGQFAEHCREFENAHRDLLHRFEQMKSQCQELQRDLTMRRCLAKKDEVLELGVKIEDIQSVLDKHYNTLENKLPLLEKHWEESLERIVNEQDLYQAQLQDVMRLKQESQHLRVITSQLVSFVSSIAAVTERLAPKGHWHPCLYAHRESALHWLFFSPLFMGNFMLRTASLLWNLQASGKVMQQNSVEGLYC
ncbi:RING finger protein 207-like [Plakobranchus ocellatus]|uniref:RING finger protein 207 n=1 Tax=Plakobranchus ocellatus TaxID=259542 RepID=A0AAV3Y3M2_9GAST|nr:RING finger protein 207-like [Plakobranchus ocellatus]